MFKVVSSSPTFGLYSKDPIDLLQSKGCQVQILPKDITSNEEEFANALSDADALVVGVENITQEVLKYATKLKVIAKHGAGVDNIDLNEAAKRGILVANAPGANKHAVADMVFGLFLSIARQIPFSAQEVKEKKWPRVVGNEIFQKTLGVIGTGRIGKEVIHRAQGFNMKVLCYDVYQDNQLEKQGVGKYVTIHELLKQSDFITIHTDLNQGTKAMIGEKELSYMKRNAFLVNTARGGIIDENALYQALKTGLIKGAAMDVFETEPLLDSPLVELPNFIATPHMAGYTEEALREVGMLTAKNVIDVLEGKQAAYLVTS
ncbi:phosphoglycerate dehydrogenase [Mesobacillus jeotgali]|uniref:phosphoglycerate dehydrogenase n=1 Tax=Mesobacillus jeotgali TaxID=129985 RepID=UPI000C85E7F3|nr:phosphoglycerate dehydrogenase [Mesobacillus jeotgali]